MSTGGTPFTLKMSSIAVAFAATMAAMWSFAQAHLLWGGYNLAIALVALAVVVAARARDYRA